MVNAVLIYLLSYLIFFETPPAFIMNKIITLALITLSLLFSLPSCTHKAQVVPKGILPEENDSLCWRLIGFSFPAAAEGSATYKIEIAKGAYTDEESFEKNIIYTTSTSENKVIGEVPDFGCQYTWRTTSRDRSSDKEITGPLCHFSVKTSPDVDSTTLWFNVVKPNAQYKDDYIFLDYTKVLYDMNGKPVWFIPGSEQPQYRSSTPGDMKITTDSTITFITDGVGYEMTYDGLVLWRLPVKKNRYFHHEFMRLPNGHYMGLTYKDINGDIPPLRKDTVITDAYDSSGYYRSRLYTNLEEYDRQGNMVWSWDGMQYNNRSDMRLRKWGDVPEMDHDLHPNAFFFDTKNNVIYLSLRNINRIIKIKYPEGKVLNTYGNVYHPGSWNMDNGLFSGQHSLGVSHDGYLYMYNNNIAAKWHIPTLAMFAEPAPGGTELKKVWEYQFPANVDSAVAAKLFFLQGGSAHELADGSFFVMMGRQCPKMWIINRDKQVVWSAVPEKFDSARGRWALYTGIYRAGICSRKDIEGLIWKAEKVHPEK